MIGADTVYGCGHKYDVQTQFSAYQSTMCRTCDKVKVASRIRHEEARIETMIEINKLLSEAKYEEFDKVLDLVNQDPKSLKRACELEREWLALDFRILTDELDLDNLARHEQAKWEERWGEAWEN
ncbi:MAG: hypothetical protein LQ340_007080 [Diploschistes diacapsis]|nr:MAG: hypothetical protein LQ340_007080 [Diploschistes diacapsis]